MKKGGTCCAHANAHSHTHPRTALPGYDNYSQLRRDSAVGETVEDIWREGERNTEERRKKKKKKIK